MKDIIQFMTFLSLIYLKTINNSMKSFRTFVENVSFGSHKRISAALKTDPNLQAALRLCKKIEKQRIGGSCIIVGGYVRDLLYGKMPKDIDLATNVEFDDVVKIDGVTLYDIGQSQQHGIKGISYEGHNYELAHFRKEEGYSDFRRPDKVYKIENFKDDAARRDFTINSMGLDSDGNLLDYYNGIEDLNKGLIKTVGSPEARFMEDALRILRALRFAARLDFDIEAGTKKAINVLKDNLKKISVERVRQELFSIAKEGGPQLAKFIELMDDPGINLLKDILPEIKDMQGHEHHPDSHPEGGVYEHTLAALRQSSSKSPIVNLAILFHDIGKPLNKEYGETGKVQYKGHEDSGFKLFNNIADRLKFSNEEKEAIGFAIAHHMLGHLFPPRAEGKATIGDTKILSLRQNKNWEVLKNLIQADDSARGAKFDREDLQRRFNYVEDLAKRFGEKKEFEDKMSKLVNGKIILSLFPTMSGINIGIIKKLTREFIQNSPEGFDISPQKVLDYITQLGKKYS